jgi:TPR repeat protein
MLLESRTPPHSHDFSAADPELAAAHFEVGLWYLTGRHGVEANFELAAHHLYASLALGYADACEAGVFAAARGTLPRQAASIFDLVFTGFRTA